MVKRAVLAIVAALGLLTLFVDGRSAILLVAMISVLLFSTEAMGLIPSCFLLLTLLSLSLDAAERHLAFSGFQSSILYFLIAATGVGTAVSKSGLGRWFIVRLKGVVYKTRYPLPALLVGSFFPLSFILPSSVTRNAVLHPLLDEFLDTQPLGYLDAPRVRLTLGMLNPLASSALLTGGLAPMVSASLLGGFSWGRWFVLMAVPYYLLMLAGLGYLLARYKVPEEHKMSQPGEEIHSEKVRLCRSDWFILAILLMMVLFWVTDFWHGLPAVVPAIAGFTALLIGGCVEWSDIKRTQTWDTVIVLGTLLSLVEAVKHYGVLDLLVGRLEAVLPPSGNELLLLLGFMLATVLFNLLIPSITVCLTLLIPIFTQLAASLGLNPVLVGLIITMTVDSVKLYPTQSTPLLMVYDNRVFKTRDVATMGIFMLAMLSVLGIVIFRPYWGMLGIR